MLIHGDQYISAIDLCKSLWFMGKVDVKSANWFTWYADVAIRYRIMQVMPSGCSGLYYGWVPVYKEESFWELYRRKNRSSSGRKLCSVVYRQSRRLKTFSGDQLRIKETLTRLWIFDRWSTWCLWNVQSAATILAKYLIYIY